MRGGLVLAPDIAALDQDKAVVAEADKGAGGNFLRFVEDGRFVIIVDEEFSHILQLVFRFIGQLVHRRLVEFLEFRRKRFEFRYLFIAQGWRNRFQRPESAMMVPGEIDRRFDPAPAFRFDGPGFDSELFAGELFEKGNVLQPSVLVRGEKIAQNDAAGFFVSLGANKKRAPVIGTDRLFGQHTPDGVRAAVPMALEGSPDFFLALPVFDEAEGHELFEREFVILISLKEQRAGARKPEALSDDGGSDAEGSGNRVLALSLVAQGGEGAELVDRMKGFALGVFGEAVGLDEASAADDAGDRRVLGELLLFDEHLQRAQAASARLNAIATGFRAGVVDERAHAQALQKSAARDVGGEVFDRNAGLDLADIAVMDAELVEGDGLRRGEGKFLGGGGFGHRRVLLGWGSGPALRLSLGPCPSPSFANPLPLVYCRGNRSQGPNPVFAARPYYRERPQLELLPVLALPC